MVMTGLGICGGWVLRIWGQWQVSLSSVPSSPSVGSRVWQVLPEHQAAVRGRTAHRAAEGLVERPTEATEQLWRRQEGAEGFPDTADVSSGAGSPAVFAPCPLPEGIGRNKSGYEMYCPPLCPSLFICLSLSLLPSIIHPSTYPSIHASIHFFHSVLPERLLWTTD